MGSAWYMSPEQVRGAHELDARTDIYAMGAVVHEMLTGRKLFDGNGSLAVMCAQMEEIPQRPSALNPEIPVALDSIVAQALAKDPMCRFQNANEFRIALDNWDSAERYSAVPEVRPGPHIVNAPDSHLNRFLTSLVTTPRVLALATAVAIVGTAVVLPPKVTRIGGMRVAPQALSAPTQMAEQKYANKPTPAEAIPPDPTASGHAPQVSMNTATRSSSSVPLMASGQTRQQPSTVRGLARAANSGSPALPPKLSPPADSVSQTTEPAKPQRERNRFIRALSKLNPFHSRAKNDPVGPERVGTTESIER